MILLRNRLKLFYRISRVNSSIMSGIPKTPKMIFIILPPVEQFKVMLTLQLFAMPEQRRMKHSLLSLVVRVKGYNTTERGKGVLLKGKVNHLTYCHHPL